MTISIKRFVFLLSCCLGIATFFSGTLFRSSHFSSEPPDDLPPYSGNEQWTALDPMLAPPVDNLAPRQKPLSYAHSQHDYAHPHTVFQPQYETAPSDDSMRWFLNAGAFSNKNGFDRPKYYRTIRTAFVHGEPYVIGRAACGLLIYKYAHGQVVSVSKCDIEFSDKNGWNTEDHWSTIGATVVNDSLYITGRSDCGMHIYKLVDDKVTTLSICEIDFSNENGWEAREHYETIQTSQANGNLFILGRGECGMHIHQTWKDRVYLVNRCLIPFSNANHWDQHKYYSTITTATVMNHIYVLGRTQCGMVVYKTLTGKTVELVSHCEIPWTDESYKGVSEWVSHKYYSTIQAVATNDTVLVFGRNFCGLIVWRVDEKVHKVYGNYFCTIPFSDENGWDQPDHYLTIGATVIDEIVYVYGRNNCGMEVYSFHKSHIYEPVNLVRKCSPILPNIAGWNKQEQYFTIQGIAAPTGVILAARSKCGANLYLFNDKTSGSIVDCI